MHDKLILAAHNWASNAELIQDCAALGYLNEDWNILDPTYGKGNWWKLWWPRALVKHDMALDGTDFRKLPYADNTFDAITYDPPYVSVGGRKTTGMSTMYEAYGLIDAPSSPAELQVLINDGLTEMYRLVKKGGYVLVKNQDYVSSGKLWIGTHWTLSHALELGFTCQDRLEHMGKSRPQPSHARQLHARRNLSTMFVLKG